jgi:FkbM family methyltransferase
MKRFLRSVQTFFPFLHDLRFNLKFIWIRGFKSPSEKDFNALKLFNPQTDQVFVDVGANRGEAILSMLIEKRLSNKIIAFEPNPWVFKKIERNPIISKKRLELYNFGLGSENEDLTLFVPFYRRWMFDGLSSFHYEEARDWLRDRLWKFRDKDLSIQKMTCQVRKLDDFQLNPYFVKIDVQGHELEVLKGGIETLKRHHPVLLIESMTEEIMQFLKPLGYQFYAFNNREFSLGTGTLNTFCITAEQYQTFRK